MPATVYVLSKTNYPSLVIAVFAHRGMALDAARSWALHRAARCRETDLKTFGPSGAGAYEVVVDESDGRTRVSVLHCPSGEYDARAWHVSPHEIVGPPACVEPQQPELFPPLQESVT